MHKTLKSAAVLLLLGACGTQLAAQTQKTITFGSSNSKSSKSSKNKHHSSGYGKNSVTVGVLSYLDGFTALTYERMLTESFTVAVGAGTTYRNFWMQVGDAVRGTSPDYSSSNSRGPNRWDIQDDYGDFTSRRAMNGTYVSLSPKFYPSGESLDGSYVAPLIEYRNYRFSADKAETGIFRQQYAPGDYESDVPRSRERVTETVRCLDVSAIWGGHYQLRGHIVIGYSVGVGFRNVKANRLDLGYEQLTDDTYQYTNDMNETTSTRFLGNVGFSVGGWW